MSTDLMKMIEAEARTERERALAAARDEAATILEEARREAAEHVEAARARLESEFAAGRVRAESTASVRASALVLRAKDEAITRVFADAAARLERTAGDPARRRGLLRALIAEAATGLEGRVAVEVNPRDRTEAEAIVAELGLTATVREAPGIASGTRVTSADGRFVVENTLATRLGRARPALVTEVAKTLWG